MSITHYPHVCYVENNIIGSQNSTAYDAFGRLRVSNPLTIFDSKNIMSKNNLFDEQLINFGSINYTSNNSTVNLNVTTASGDKVVRQSKRVMSYQPGKSLLNLNTFVFNTQTNNLEQRVGMFDTNNGIFLEDTGSNYQIVRRTYTSGTPVDNEVLQSNWNGDKLDGTGASGYDLNFDRPTIMFMDFEWLGMGAVRVGFVVDGKFIVAHTFYNANNPLVDTVYMQTANLPIRYEIETVGAIGSAATLQQVCSTVMIEGGYSPEGLQSAVGTSTINTAVTLSTANTWYNIVTLKIKSGRPYAVIVPAGLDVLNIANADFEYGLFVNATPGSAFSYTSYSDNVEYDLQMTNLSSTGTRIAGGYLGGKTAPATFGDGRIPFSFQLGQTINGVSDTLTLGLRCASNSSKAAGLLRWYDLT